MHDARHHKAEASVNQRNDTLMTWIDLIVRSFGMCVWPAHDCARSHGHGCHRAPRAAEHNSSVWGSARHNFRQCDQTWV